MLYVGVSLIGFADLKKQLTFVLPYASLEAVATKTTALVFDTLEITAHTDQGLFIYAFTGLSSIQSAAEVYNI